MSEANNSLDPRIQRLELPQGESTVKPNEYWGTFEVFLQEKRGKYHQHVGSLHAPDQDMALIFAKEQYGRRGKCVDDGFDGGTLELERGLVDHQA